MSHFEPSIRYTKRGSLHLDSLSGQTDEEASNGSPSSTIATNSPNSTFQPGSASFIHPRQIKTEEDDREPSSGPQRQGSSAVKSDKEKRKRSRVTPEQLVRLEQYFAKDRSPTASRRREISDILGMQERQTQIWFQNRRAKAKLQDGKEGSRRASTETPQDISGGNPSNFEVDLQSLVYEDQSVIIPCTDLTIGTWHRIASSDSKHDLIAYISEAKRRLNWFIHSDSYGFKMEIPFETVTDAQFQPAGPASGFATFFLSQPPLFFIETMSSPQADGTVSRGWKRCSDWTQGHQATEVLHHTLTGSAPQLLQIIRVLRTFKCVSEASPTYRGDATISRPMEIPPPPLAGINTAGFMYSEVPRPTNFGYVDHLRKRSSYSAHETHYTPDFRPTAQSAPVEMKHMPYPPPDSRSNIPDYQLTTAHTYRWTSNQSTMLPGHTVDSPPRSYATQAHRYPNRSPRSLQDFQPEVDHPSTSDSALLYGASSPRLLTTPYYPTTNISSAFNRSSQTPSDRTGIVYEFDEDLRSRRSH